MSLIRNVNVHDGAGNAINSFDGALDSHDADVHHIIINEYFHQHTAVTTTFAADAPAGSTQITLTDATGFAVGDYLHLIDGVVETLHPRITVLVGTLATLDRPLDNTFLIGDTIEKSLINIVSIGSLASPQSFIVQPLSNQVWHLTRMMLSMVHTTASDSGTFGDLNQLANGVLLRRYDGASGSYSTYTIWRDNADIAVDLYDLDFLPLSKKGSYGTKGRGTFTNAGAIIYLDGAVGDYLEVLVQDDLTIAGTMQKFTIKAQGHREGA